MLPKRLSRHRNPSAQWLSLPQQISSVLGSPKSQWDRASERMGSQIGSRKKEYSALR